MSQTKTIVIPYYSGSGHTRVLAKAIAEGAGGATLIDVKRVSDAQWAAMDAADAIIFGTPTYMGSSAARYDKFLEHASIRWPDQTWGDKIAAGFTVATYPSGDKFSTLMRLCVYAAQMGMIWVGQKEIGAPVHPDRGAVNSQGSWLGLMAMSSRDKGQMVGEEDLITARVFGARIAMAVDRWRV
ncbi:MAG: NAD(P)H-dependent oxidoreductase [Pseudomonadota bacterium]